MLRPLDAQQRRRDRRYRNRRLTVSQAPHRGRTRLQDLGMRRHCLPGNYVERRQ
jgi:hypothetical protein